MKNVYVSIIIALMAVGIGLYAQEKEVQGEPVQTEEIRLELVWERDIPEGTKDIILLDEDGYNIFSSQCKDPEHALEKMQMLMNYGEKVTLMSADFDVENEIIFKPHSKVAISKNGRNIAVIEGMERYKYEEIIENNVQNKNPGDFKNTHATIRLLNWRGEELARTQISIKEWDYIDLFPLGNDKTIALNFTGGEGRIYKAKVLVKNEHMLSDILSMEDACIWDYAENGSTVMLSILNPSTQYSKERRILNDEAEVIARYTYEPVRGTYLGLVSARGNYIAEVTTGKYLVIYDRYGKLIKEHKVQGAGNYYAAFSPDENYLCVTPGPWRIYLLQTKEGEMLWDYVHPDSFILFLNVATSNDGTAYVYSQPWSYPRPDRKTVPNPLLPEKSLHIFNIEGQLVDLLRPVEKIYSIRLTSDGRYLLVRFPSKLHLYRVVSGGGR